MPKETSIIWLADTHRLSGRTAVLDDDGESCWLYLCADGGRSILKSVFVYSPVEPVDRATWKKKISAGEAPVLIADYASGAAVVAERYPDDFAFRWREDGDAVAVLFRDVAIAVVSVDEKHGSSKAIGRSGPFGDPLQIESYEWLR